jgi:hypothetical protein
MDLEAMQAEMRARQVGQSTGFRRCGSRYLLAFGRPNQPLLPVLFSGLLWRASNGCETESANAPEAVVMPSCIFGYSPY